MSKVRNFDEGLMIKQVCGSMGKDWGRMGEYREFGRVWMVGELGNSLSS